jgi:uncharacterized protein (TIGR02594 family)
MSDLPTAYQWLEALQPLPLIVRHAIAEYGVIEGSGTADNPVILSWADEVGLANSFSHDAIPWCGLFMALVAKRAGKSIPARPLWALSWASFGAPAPQPGLGDVMVFRRDGGGHVALYIGEDAAAYHVLGGNQSDRVCFTRMAKNRLHAARRPAYHLPPLTVRRYELAAAGSLSRNEA